MDIFDQRNRHALSWLMGLGSDPDGNRCHLSPPIEIEIVPELQNDYRILARGVLKRVLRLDFRLWPDPVTEHENQHALIPHPEQGLIGNRPDIRIRDKGPKTTSPKYCTSTIK